MPPVTELSSASANSLRGGIRRRSALVTALVAGVTALCPRGAAADPPSETPRLEEGQHFTIDPVVDGVLILGGAGFAGVLGLLLGTGEIRPVPPGDTRNLLGIDKVAVTQAIDPHANRNSNIGLWLAYGYAVFDPIRAGVRDGADATVVDAIMYAESVALTKVLTDITKFAVRRPRPIDYVVCSGTAETRTDMCTTNTDLQLSFFSGHAASTAAVAATAAYLAFVRQPRGLRPWLTLAAGVALTAFVSYERVRSGQHFPTDVIMGSIAGGAVGVLVPHFHRRAHYHWKELETPSVLIGFVPTARGDGTVTATWQF